MCTNRDIDTILNQLQGCKDAEHMRRLLDEANRCHECPEESGACDEKGPDCYCRRRFQQELQTLMHSIRTK